MNITARTSFVAGIALAAGGFFLTAAADHPVYTADNPQECSEGYVHAEDYSCVPATFWDEAPAPVTLDREPAPIVEVVIPEIEVPAPPVVEVPAVEVPTPTYTLPACEFEDSTNCYWDASARGNGSGTSFINLDGVYYYPEG